MSNIKIQDDVLPSAIHQQLNAILFGDKFPWYYTSGVTSPDEIDTRSEDLGVYKFCHVFYANGKPNSDFYELVSPLIQVMDMAAIIYIRAFMCTYTGAPYVGPMHVDVDNRKTHRTSIYYLNTNNGYTLLHDGTKIDAVANRLATFDGTTKHAGITSTDVKARVVINFNYYS